MTSWKDMKLTPINADGTKPKVWFMDLRTSPGNNLLNKLEKLIKKAGIEQIDFKKKITAIKIHFGEPGNLAYIRPNYAAVIAKFVQKREGLPFLTDSNTLYKGRRANGVDHLQSAMENGFNVIATGCNVVIADGIKGTEYRLIETGLPMCPQAKIGSAIADADILISMNHFKGHELTGFGGCLKNLGMGSGSIGGKLEMHSDSQPQISQQNCTGCNICVKNCAHDAIHLNPKRKAEIDYVKCVGCGQCIAVCQFDGAQVRWDARSTQKKMVEYAYAAIKDKPSFHINFVMNVSPNCDCWSNNDASIVADIGIL